MLRQYYYIALGLVFATSAVAQAPDSEDLLEQLQTAQEGLALLESRFDRYDSRLVEVLEQLADRFIALKQYDDAHEVLDRATQITRVAEGLYTPLQLPLLQKKISNFANRGNWQSARTQAEHLLWLYHEKTPIGSDLVYGLLNLTDFHLRGVVEDQPSIQAYHFRRAMAANELALLVAQNIWEEHDPRLATIIYQMVKQHYLQVAAVDLGGETGYALREIVPGTGWVQDRNTVRRQHYYMGLNLLQQLSAVYDSATAPNPEALAMVNLYIADWQVLHTRRDEALSNYQTAHAGLLAAGIDAAQIDAYLTIPEALPVSEFYPSIAAAQSGRNALPRMQPPEAARPNLLALQFNAWSPDFPNVREPTFRTRATDPNADYALFSVNLTGLTEVTRWVSGRYLTGIGVAEALAILEVQMDRAADDEDLLNKLHALRFRPGLVEGQPTQASGTLRYIVTNE